MIGVPQIWFCGFSLPRQLRPSAGGKQNWWQASSVRVWGGYVPGGENWCLTIRGKYFHLLESALWKCFQPCHNHGSIPLAEAADLLSAWRKLSPGRSRMGLLPFFFFFLFNFFFLSLSLALQSWCSAVWAGCSVVLWSLVIEEKLLVLLQAEGTGGRSGSESLPRPFLADLWLGFRGRICVELSVCVVQLPNLTRMQESTAVCSPWQAHRADSLMPALFCSLPLNR